jgi:hypothetical protein
MMFELDDIEFMDMEPPVDPQQDVVALAHRLASWHTDSNSLPVHPGVRAEATAYGASAQSPCLYHSSSSPASASGCTCLHVLVLASPAQACSAHTHTPDAVPSLPWLPCPACPRPMLPVLLARPQQQMLLVACQCGVATRARAPPIALAPGPPALAQVQAQTQVQAQGDAGCLCSVTAAALDATGGAIGGTIEAHRRGGCGAAPVFRMQGELLSAACQCGFSCNVVVP